jgi:nitrate reductase gamma subunit
VTSALAVLVWVAFPYACLTLLVGGLVWRWRTDQFGWTTRSSQLHERAILRVASPLFHVGFLLVIAGHLLGLLVPATWTEAVGIDEHAYHLIATGAGSLAAAMTVAGLVGLLYRRFVVRSVRLATSRGDKVTYAFLTVPIALGTWATVSNQILGPPGSYDYRSTISPWLRSVLTFAPQPQLMADVPLSFRLHVVAGFALLAIWPFTRLVHAVSAPVGYPTRPYVVYRARAAAVAPVPSRRGWKPVHTTHDEPGADARGA